MGSSGRYRNNAGAVFSLKYHVVFCPKYRRNVLTPPVDSRLKEVLADTAATHGITLHNIEVMPDHVHLFVETDPTFSPAEVVHRLKGASSRALRAEFRQIRSRLPTLWSRSYYVGPVGVVSEAVVRRYIEAQKGA